MATLHLQAIICWLLCLTATALGSVSAHHSKRVSSLSRGLLSATILCRGLPAGARLCSYIFLPAFILGLITAVFLRECVRKREQALPLITAFNSIVVGGLLHSGHISHILSLLPLFAAEGSLLSPGYILPVMIPLCLPLPLSDKVSGVMIALAGGMMLQGSMNHRDELHPGQYITGMTTGVILSFIN